MFARPTTESRLLETLARDLAALLAGNRKHEVLCVAEHSPVWSGAACGDGRGLVTRWSANDRFVRLLYGCHVSRAFTDFNKKEVLQTATLGGLSWALHELLRSHPKLAT